MEGHVLVSISIKEQNLTPRRPPCETLVFGFETHGLSCGYRLADLKWG